MATSEFLPYGTAVGANVATQAAYAADATIAPGMSSGIVPSARMNKILRQATFIAAVVAQYMADTAGVTVADDGDKAGKQTILANAVTAAAIAAARSIIATQAQMEAATDNTTFVTPLRVKSHPGVAKAAGSVSAAGVGSALYNVASVTKTGTGTYQVAFTSVMSSAAYQVLVLGFNGDFFPTVISPKATNLFVVRMDSGSGSLPASPVDAAFDFVVFGDMP
jgi:hypothetical protein